MKIGVFDSGFGGLTVLHELRTWLPEYSYVYVGDNARAPYGIRSQETIYEYTKQAMRFLFESHDCALVIIACNTASAEALSRLQKEYVPMLGNDAYRILGVLIPTAEEAVEVTRGQVGVIATRSTVSSNAFEREIHKLNEDVNVHQRSTPLLVPLIEEGWGNKPETAMIVKKYLRSLKSAHIDTLILGCTHYPIIESTIKRAVGKQVRVVTSAQATGKRLLGYLKKHTELEKMLVKTSEVQYFTTDDPDRFRQVGQSIFKGDLANVHHIHLI